MKKIIFATLLLIAFPLNIFAYSEKIVYGGDNIGIIINTEGLIVVGFYKVEGTFIGKETLKVGDIIIEIEGIEVNDINEMSNIIEEKVENDNVNIKIKRNGKIISTKLNLKKSDNLYKTGLYVKEKVTGIGTITYIDPITKIYGALGHEIALNEINSRVEVKSGNIFESFVTGIERSSEGKIGSKNASIKYNKEIGDIIKNTPVGVFGNYLGFINIKNLIDVADFNEINLGEAYIYTNIEGMEARTYKINITDLNNSKVKTSKSISFEIVDDELLENTGGVIQGMSGSPIIQNNKIIGAVTHVVVSSPNKGYGVFIRTMLEKGEE